MGKCGRYLAVSVDGLPSGLPRLVFWTSNINLAIINIKLVVKIESGWDHPVCNTRSQWVKIGPGEITFERCREQEKTIYSESIKGIFTESLLHVRPFARP